MVGNRFILTFHGIGDPPSEVSDSEAQYWIGTGLFQSIVDLFQRMNTRYQLSLTFDDGNKSDYEIAFPRLARAGLSATFFVLAGKIGHPHFLSAGQIAEMASAGMTIGLHGMDHLDWTRASDSVLDRELRDARSAIARHIGRPVQEVAIPFGRYDNRVIRRLDVENFSDVYTSDGGMRLINGRVKARYSVRRDTDVVQLERRIQNAFGVRQRLIAEGQFRLKSARLTI